MAHKNHLCFLFLLCILYCNTISGQSEEDDITVEDEVVTEETEDDFDVLYATPPKPPKAYFVETFDDISTFEKHWIKSTAKKNDVEDSVAKYDGLWDVEFLEKNALSGDRGLVLKSKAKHAAISSLLPRPFIFKDKPFVVQYEVNLQNGQDCGGSYIKLLSQPKTGKLNLKEFHDKTPYTIMFGPDKCGNEEKFHFIFRHVNPLNNTIEEKHCKSKDGSFSNIFKDKKTHLITLVIKKDSTFTILVDEESILNGDLLEDFTPPVNPPKQIDDPNDFKPNDWDEREKIPDPDAVKPEDWDEDAPRQIVDPSASKHRGWLDNEPELIPDPEAEKPDDWDSDMDGDWEAPLINNPKCAEAPGCGEWKPPMIDNPNYKGKWIAPSIDNPNYRGKWSPRKIGNPFYFEDLEPFKMTSIGAVGIELWSMSNNIYFDNILITDDPDEAQQFAAETFHLKVMKVEKGDKGILKRIVDFSNKNPWIHAVYVLLAAVPVVLIYMCCCAQDKDAERKKTDEPTEDDPQEEEKNQEQEEVAPEGEKNVGQKVGGDLEEEDETEEEEEEGGEEEEEEKSAGSDKEVESDKEGVKTSLRERKVRKE